MCRIETFSGRDSPERAFASRSHRVASRSQTDKARPQSGARAAEPERARRYRAAETDNPETDSLEIDSPEVGNLADEYGQTTRGGTLQYNLAEYKPVFHAPVRPAQSKSIRQSGPRPNVHLTQRRAACLPARNLWR